MDVATRFAVALVLLTAVAAKLRMASALPELLGAYGVPPPLRALAAVALVASEAALGLLLAAGVAVRPAALATVALGGIFALAIASARLRGARRLRCGCFGTKERPASVLLGRALGLSALAGLAALADAVDGRTPSREAVVLVGLGILAVAVLVLGVLVLALYRQVGVLSLRIGPRAALELAEEGPPVGAPAPALAGLARSGPELVAFFSEGCRLCRELAPAVRALERGGLPVRVVSEEREAGVLDRWNVPGTPFCVHLIDGVVAAKGLVNTLEELDGLVALGRARREHAAA